MNPERLNIKDLTIEEPEKPVELGFDPEKDITESDWKEIITHYLDDLRQDKGWTNWARVLLAHARNIKVLDPSYDFKFTEKEWRLMKGALRLSDGKLAFSPAVSLKIINPEYDLGLTLEDEKRIEESLEEVQEEGRIFNIISRIAEIKIINPSQNLSMDKIVDMEELNKELEEFKKTDSWGLFVQLASKVKILDPNFNFHLTQEDWRKMKSTLDEKRNPKWSQWNHFTESAADMKIIAAPDVQVTKNGLEISMSGTKESDESENIALPEQRNF